MPNLPVRIELKSGIGDLYCRFTIVDVSFVVTPTKGDPVEFNYDDWSERVIGTVQYIYHSIGKTPGSMIFCTIVLADETEMIAAFDKFKDSVEISDPDTGGNRPPSYYPAYRLISRIWGKKVFVYGVDHPTVLAELIRAAYLAGGGAAEQSVINKAIELVHKLIIECKSRQRGESLDLLMLLRKWDRETGLCVLMGTADDAFTIEITKRLCAGLKSIHPDKLPIALR